MLFHGFRSNVNNSENPLQATQETTTASESLALVLVPDPNVKHGVEPTQCDPNIVIE